MMGNLGRRLSGAVPEFFVIVVQIMGMALIVLRAMNDDIGNYYEELGLFAGLIILLFILRRVLNRLSKGDTYIFLIVEMLVSIGILMIYRLDRESGMKQGMWLIVSLVAFFSVYVILKNFKFFDKLFYPYIIMSFVLFAATLILGNRVKGAINWIDLGIISFQPAEITKLLLVFTLASYYSNMDVVKLKDRVEYNNLWEKYGGFLISFIVYLYIGLLFLQRDLGMAVVFFSILLSVQFVYEKDRRVLLLNLAVALVGAVLAFFIFTHVRVRVDAWLDPLKYIDGKGYQITQSSIAISEGGLFGTGLWLGYPSYIPAVKTDFIFSAICEEMGLFTGVAVILLFLLLVYRAIKVALTSDNYFLRILSFGLAATIGFQVFIILGGVTKFIPMTGITLPFVSYGGSSLLTSFLLIGILQYASESD